MPRNIPQHRPCCIPQLPPFIRMGKGPLGIISSDYVLRNEYSGSELVYKIIENNFT